MGSYKIEFKRSAERDVRKIGALLIPKILESVDALASEPFPRRSVKLSGTEATYRMRVGAYRVIYSVDTKTDTIVVYYIRHRREAYRQL
jgi:mRNA interferase RelE/StbE